MKTVTYTQNLYTFNELSETAKEKACDWYRESSMGDAFFAESVTELAKDSAKMLGIDIDNIYWSGFSSQGDGASFTGSYKYAKGWKAKLCKEFGGKLLDKLIEIGEELQAAQSAVFYTGEATIRQRGNYSHSGTMRFGCEAEKGDFSYFEESVENALRNFADWIYNSLETEYDYQNSDEAVIEAILANEYEFTEDGQIY